jgi:hypothetical protein
MEYVTTIGLEVHLKLNFGEPQLKNEIKGIIKGNLDAETSPDFSL